MITEISFENYRCFERLKVSDLKRINIIVGHNGRGKTAFLEGLYMLCGGSPELYFRTRAWRGLSPQIRLKASDKANEGLFSSLFSHHDTKHNVLLEMMDRTSGRRSLRIYFSKSEMVTFPLDSIEKGEQGAGSAVPVTFEWSLPSGDSHAASVQVLDDTITMPSSTEVFPAVFLSPITVSVPTETGKRFSEVSKRGRLQPVLREVETIYPELSDLSLEYEGEVSIVHAKTHLSEEKLPLQFISGGITKYLSVLLAVVTSQSGVVLVDEIENGFYFGKLDDVWQSFARQCKQQNTQMFLTTHSWEFLKAVGSASKDSPDDYCLLRAEEDKGTITLRQFAGKKMLAAIKQGMELR